MLKSLKYKQYLSKAPYSLFLVHKICFRKLLIASIVLSLASPHHSKVGRLSMHRNVILLDMSIQPDALLEDRALHLSHDTQMLVLTINYH